MDRSSTTIGLPWQIYAMDRGWRPGRGVFGWEVMVGREGIEPPQSKTADLQSAELTTCSTYPRIAADAWCSPTVADGIRPVRPPQLMIGGWSRGWGPCRARLTIAE